MMLLPKSIEYRIPAKEEVPANAVSWQMDTSRVALLIHDMQHYFMNGYEKSGDPFNTILHNITRLSMAARQANIPIFYTAQTGDQDADERGLLTDFWGKGITANTAHTDILESLAPQEGDICLKKWRYSAFKKSNFQQLLSEKNCNQLIIVGVYSHIGCLSTALDAFMLDIKPFFPIDAMGDFSREDHLMAASYVAKRCGFVTDTDQLIDAIHGRSPVPKTMDAIKKLLAGYLNMTETAIADDAYLPDLGLDSIRLMQLAEQWHSHGIGYLGLVQNPTPQGWLKLLLVS